MGCFQVGWIGGDKMAVVLSGAVIIKQSGDMLSFKGKCEKCGAVQYGTTIIGVPGHNVTHTERFTCSNSKCSNVQKVAIKG